MRRTAAIIVAVAALMPASSAAASQISGTGATVTYTAAPGEQNHVLVTVTPYDSLCGSVGTPCLQVWDSGARMTAVSGTCVLETSDPITGDTARCTLPNAVVADLGDRDDSYWDWDGPSTIDAGSGNDNPIYGEGGDDVIRGGIGSDVLIGQAGDDVLDGGPGDDDLDGIPGAGEDESATRGADTYIGGGGNDSLTYETRSENLALSPDGVANDGAAGEGDNIGTDITTIVGGHGSDTLTGNAGRNVFGGGEGDDVLTGGGGDDQLAGGPGADKLYGGDGQDVLGATTATTCWSGRRRRPLLGRRRRRLHRVLLRERPGPDRGPRRRARAGRLRARHRHARGRRGRLVPRLGRPLRPVRERRPRGRGGGRRAGRGGGGFTVAAARVDRASRIVVRVSLPGPGSSAGAPAPERSRWAAARAASPAPGT